MSKGKNSSDLSADWRNLYAQQKHLLATGKISKEKFKELSSKIPKKHRY